ncbi:hypothetical protein BE04_35505 [Sorangium cellulosum]|uniref:Uncharacterized protein n=1 Tax=Sorangium cellulosum TaxID=56 RepID=A0A150PJP4_SORCE|nr:hypothetical protein BE04_35505 [Sorangium cellulosum]
MLVAAAMAGCAAGSADMSNDEMVADMEMVESSEAALERADDSESATMNPLAESTRTDELGAYGATADDSEGGSAAYGGEGQYGHHGHCPPPDKFCPHRTPTQCSSSFTVFQPRPPDQDR